MINQAPQAAVENSSSLHSKKAQTKMVDDYPLVTVGIPTYNGSARIVNAVKSILGQGYPNLEILISDNCSTDNTEEICRDMSHNLPFVRYFRQSMNIGIMANFEFVLREATGDFFMWISDDDSLEPGILFKYVKFLEENPDYALVSGQIQYWMGSKLVLSEKGFNIEQDSRSLRAMNFYFKVRYGSIFYGLMRRHYAQHIPLRNRMGDDWHFVATMAYLGKIKNLECTGYNKKCGGVSANFKRYARTIGASFFSERFPHLQIAIDAFLDVLFRSPIYVNKPRHEKFLLATSCFLSVLGSYYGKVYPFIIGGKLKRLFGLKTKRSTILANQA